MKDQVHNVHIFFLLDGRKEEVVHLDGALDTRKELTKQSEPATGEVR